MNKMRALIILFTLLLIFSSTAKAQYTPTTKYRWTRLCTEYGELDLPNKGTVQTDCLVADFNKDGTDEFIIIEKTENPAIVMYTHIEGRKWEKQSIEKRKIQVGESADFCDIDGDGDLDIAVGSEESNQIWWWENPYPNFGPEKIWKRYYIKKSGTILHHDMAFGDYDGDGQIELAFWNQGENSLFVAEKPENIKKEDEWPLTKIFSYNTDCQMLQRSNDTELKNHPINFHSGICNADINLDGIDDIIAGGMYFYFKEGKYIQNDIDKSYISSKVVAGQLIEGGRPEIVMVSGDGEGPLVLYNFDNGSWKQNILLKFTRRAHSLQLIDFDKDGDIDIFLSEMKTKDVTDSKVFILLNNGAPNFEKLEVASNFGTHNSGVGDFDGDGDYDIIGKPYAWDTPRLDLWINEGKK
jgi:hypothetical protein